MRGTPAATPPPSVAPRGHAPETTVRIPRCDETIRGELEPLLAPGVRFASCYAYAPLGDGPLCAAAREMRARLKEADPRWIARFAAEVWTVRMRERSFAALFDGNVVLVPVPGSSPQPGGPWVGERLAWCLREMGLARALWPCVRRRYRVRKSAFAASGERPSVLEHFASFAVDRLQDTASTPRLVLVDDVITRGRTLLAAAARLREAFPGSEIRAFAMMRTLGRGEVPSRNPDPCEGAVRWLRGDARREP